MSNPPQGRGRTRRGSAENGPHQSIPRSRRPDVEILRGGLRDAEYLTSWHRAPTSRQILTAEGGRLQTPAAAARMEAHRSVRNQPGSLRRKRWTPGTDLSGVTIAGESLRIADGEVMMPPRGGLLRRAQKGKAHRSVTRIRSPFRG